MSVWDVGSQNMWRTQYEGETSDDHLCWHGVTTVFNFICVLLLTEYGI